MDNSRYPIQYGVVFVDVVYMSIVMKCPIHSHHKVDRIWEERTKLKKKKPFVKFPSVKFAAVPI